MAGLAWVAIPTLGSSASASRTTPSTLEARDGVEAFLVDSAKHAGALVLAAWIVVFFFGGGALPFASREQVVAFVSPLYGDGLANILCMATHVGVFIAKLMLVTLALEPVRRRLAVFTFERALGFCWRWAVPLSLLNIFVTAQWLGMGLDMPLSSGALWP